MDWTKDLSMQLRSLHSQHLITSAIAEMMNLPEKAVKDKLFKMGLKENEPYKTEPSEFATKQSIPQNTAKIRTQIFTFEMDNQISECLLLRMSNQETADKLGVTYQQLVSRMSWLRKTGRLEIATNKKPKGITPNENHIKSVPIPASVISFVKCHIRLLQGDFNNLRLEVQGKLAELKAIEKEREELILWLKSIENEPASAATDTSSDVNISEINNTTESEVCQDGK